MIPGYFSSSWTAVGPGLANHLWQSTLFVVVVWFLTLLLRRNQARTRYCLWLAASLKFLLPFSLLVALGSRLAAPHPETQTRIFWVMEQVSRPFKQQGLPLLPPVVPEATSLAGSNLLPALLGVAWLCGFLVVLLLWFLRWRRVAAVARQAEPVHEGREVEALWRLQRSGTLPKPVQILRSRASLEPGIFGIFRPVLLWPENISERLQDSHLEAILAHELEHARRRDNLAAAIHMLVEAFFWFHPLVWWLGARLVEEREHACDEEVLALGSRRQVYAESILKTCEFCMEVPLACVSGVTGADLKRRIARIMMQRRADKLGLSKKILLAAAGAVAVLGPVILGLAHAPQLEAQSPRRTVLWAQSLTPAGTPAMSFEVASIKPSRVKDETMKVMFNGDGLTAEGTTASLLIQMAYDLKDFQISGGPGWMDSEKYDISAKMDEAAMETLKKMPPKQAMEQRRLMLQSLLAERFKLKVSRSSKELPIYTLVVAKSGSKLAQDAPPSGPSGSAAARFQLSVGSGQIEGTAVPTSSLAEHLSYQVGRKVVDKTRLAGNYNFTLRWDPETQSPEFDGSGSVPQGPSIFTALQEQLGLKLESDKGPVETLIIDAIERPSEN